MIIYLTYALIRGCKNLIKYIFIFEFMIVKLIILGIIGIFKGLVVLFMTLLGGKLK